MAAWRIDEDCRTGLRTIDEDFLSASAGNVNRGIIERRANRDVAHDFISVVQGHQVRVRAAAGGHINDDVTARRAPQLVDAGIFRAGGPGYDLTRSGPLPRGGQVRTGPAVFGAAGGGTMELIASRNWRDGAAGRGLLSLNGFTAGRPAGADLSVGNNGKAANESKCSEGFNDTIFRFHNTNGVEVTATGGGLTESSR